MNVLAGIILGFFFAIVGVVILFLSIALFVQSFNHPQHGGGHAIAGSILVGSSLIAIAIASRRGGSDYRDYRE